jgi:hypothetical protein
MKLSLRVSILAGILATLSVSVHAQYPIARASVPFEFAAGGAMMAPGEYTVSMADVSGVIILKGSTGTSVALFTTFSAAPSRTAVTQLIFERRAGMPYLSAVEWPDQTAHLMSPFKAVTRGGATAALR